MAGSAPIGRALFEGENPLGSTILLGNVPFAVVGIVASSQSDSQTLQAYVAYSAMKTRILGNVSLGSIIVRVKDGMDTDAADQAITSLLTGRHRVNDFFTVNSDQLRRSAERTMGVLSLLISSLAAVALVVGGIGVMNIVLVSVTERTKEIGLRMAIGAGRSDIMHAETTWSASGIHTGHIDVALTQSGERSCRALGQHLVSRRKTDF